MSQSGEGKVRGSGTGRSDPPEASLTGAGGKTDVSGKDPNFHYSWLDPRHLKLQLNPTVIPDGKHAGMVIPGYTRCKRSAEAAKWEGYVSVRDGASYSEEDICNGELILFRRPRAAQEAWDEYQEEQNCLSENRELDEPGDNHTLKSNLSFTRRVGNPMTTF